MAKDARGLTLRLLLDTNIVIAHEDDDARNPHVNAKDAATLIHTARALGFELIVSSGTTRDMLRAPAHRATMRRRALDKYYRQLEAVPENPIVRAQFPTDLTSNNRADMEVLSTFATKFATALVTEDVQMRSRANRAGLNNVFSLEAAIEWVTALRPPTLDNAVGAQMCYAYQVNPRAAIFDSLQSDYEDFNEWWGKVVDEHREVIVLGDPGGPTGVAVLKAESGEFDLGEKVLKVCTFKVDEGVGRSRRGELLLRAVVDYASERSFPTAYMTVWPRHERLRGWLERFGFWHHGSTPDGQDVMVKELAPRATDEALSPLAHQIRYGPRSILVDRAFIVPIQAQYHARLIPDGEDQGSLLDNEACGNAIRKAYLSNSNIRRLTPGDTILFLRTEPDTEARVTSIGVIEDTLASSHPQEIAAFVAGRTVYSYEEICAMCNQKDALAILFRFDRRLDTPWTKQTLIDQHVMASSPQSIATVPEEGVAWVRAQLSDR